MIQPGVAQAPFAGRVPRVAIVLDMAYTVRDRAQLAEQQGEDE